MTKIPYIPPVAQTYRTTCVVGYGPFELGKTVVWGWVWEHPFTVLGPRLDVLLREGLWVMGRR